jgi:regulator of protease activity HflC (stomatin/prohibitin superfamily)
MEQNILALVLILILIVVVLPKTAVVVPQRSKFVVERLGKYRTTLEAGMAAALATFRQTTREGGGGGEKAGSGFAT